MAKPDISAFVIVNKAKQNVVAALSQVAREPLNIPLDKITLSQPERAGVSTVSIEFILGQNSFANMDEAKQFAAEAKAAIFNHSDALQVASHGNDDHEKTDIKLTDKGYAFTFELKGTVQDLADMNIEKSATAGVRKGDIQR